MLSAGSYSWIAKTPKVIERTALNLLVVYKVIGGSATIEGFHTQLITSPYGNRLKVQISYNFNISCVSGSPQLVLWEARVINANS